MADAAALSSQGRSRPRHGSLLPRTGRSCRLAAPAANGLSGVAGLPRPTCLGCIEEFWYTPPRQWSNEMMLLALLSGKDA
jgi:hypothetical protein